MNKMTRKMLLKTLHLKALKNKIKG
jgi:hypothetical protein